MSSLKRKLARKNLAKQTKVVKKAIKKFRDNLKCSICARQPEAGDVIDNWYLEKYENRMVLTCDTCKKKESSHNDE